MEYGAMSREELLAGIEELQKKLEAAKETNRELSSQLQAKDVEVLRIGRALEERQAECIRRENECRKSTEQYRSLVANLPGAVYRCANDAYWTMEFISPQIEDLTGYPASDFIDNEVRSYNSVIHPEDVIKVVDAVNEGLKHHRPYVVEYR
ncbi:MAG: PAS domain-containing protein, partial [Bacteroidota bacterium]|nr:PAS domain-containing protein [Bacteroidota bacterium]